MSDIRFKEGTVIVCPKCGEEIAKANRDINRHEKILSAPWDGVDPCTTMTCPKDGVWYFKEGQMHTDKGWV